MFGHRGTFLGIINGTYSVVNLTDVPHAPGLTIEFQYPLLNGKGMPARKNRAKGNMAIVTRMVDRSHGT